MIFGGEIWYVIGYYNERANEMWRRRMRRRGIKPRGIGPRSGEVAIEVTGPKSTVEMDRRALEERKDIGMVNMGRRS